jgi:hypothetical protein
MAETVLQAVQDHCTTLGATPSLTAVKVNALQHQSAAPVALRSPTETLTLAPQARIDGPAPSCSSRAHCTAVLRI